MGAAFRTLAPTGVADGAHPSARHPRTTSTRDRLGCGDIGESMVQQERAVRTRGTAVQAAASEFYRAG